MPYARGLEMPYIINKRILDGLPNIKITHVDNNTSLMHSIRSTPLGVMLNEEFRTGNVQIVSDVGGVIFEHEKNIPCISKLTQKTYQSILPNSRTFITNKNEIAILSSVVKPPENGTLYTIPLIEIGGVETLKHSSKLEYIKDGIFGASDQYLIDLWGDHNIDFIKFIGGDNNSFYTSIYPIPERTTIEGEFLLPELDKFKKQTYINLNGVRYIELHADGTIAPRVDRLSANSLLESLDHNRDEDRITMLMRNTMHHESNLAVELIPLKEYKRLSKDTYIVELIGILVDEA